MTVPMKVKDAETREVHERVDSVKGAKDVAVGRAMHSGVSLPRIRPRLPPRPHP
jgi:hypothetical protein